MNLCYDQSTTLNNLLSFISKKIFVQEVKTVPTTFTRIVTFVGCC